MLDPFGGEDGKPFKVKRIRNQNEKRDVAPHFQREIQKHLLSSCSELVKKSTFNRNECKKLLGKLNLRSNICAASSLFVLERKHVVRLCCRTKQFEDALLIH